MTKVTFETATLADAVKKAALVAPTTGNAFDKVAGIVMDISPYDSTVILRSSNLDIYRSESVYAIEMDGDPCTWRLPSRLFTQVITSLPIGSGKTVTMENKTVGLQQKIQITSDRVKATFTLMDENTYPSWGEFDAEALSSVAGVGGRISQVEWAAGTDLPPLTGIYFTGEQCIASDGQKIVVTPVKIEGLPKPITIPAGILSSLLANTGDIKIGMVGDQLLIAPDEHTQIRCIIYGEKYPGLSRILVTDRPNFITVRKQALVEMLSRAATFAASDRDSSMRVFIGNEEVAVVMANREIGLFGDIIEIPGQAIHDRVEIRFTAKNLTEALVNAPSEEITIGYDPDKPNGSVYLTDSAGYQCWIQPRRSERKDS